MIANRTLEGRTAVARSLADLLSERASGEGQTGFSSGEIERLGQTLCEAVESFHASGKTHGALRPSVFQLSPEGVVTLLPGAASAASTPVLCYASPEVAAGDEPTPASDTFALSLVLLELLTGRPVRSGVEEDIAALAAEGIAPMPDGVPERFTNLGLRSVTMEPEHRPTAAQWRTAFERQPPSRAPRGAVALLAASVVVLVAGLGVFRQQAVEAGVRSTARLTDARAIFEGLLLGTYDELDRIEEMGPLAAAGERALASIDAAGSIADPRSLEMLAMTLVWNGRAQRLLENREGAQAHFERAIEVASALGGGLVAVESEVAAAIALGELAIERRDFKAGRKNFDRAIKLCEAAIGDEAADRSLRIAHVRALIGAGDVVMSSGRMSAARALKLFSRAREALEDPTAGLDASELDVLVLRCDLGKLEANMAFQTGQGMLAIELLEEHVVLAQVLIERDPGSERSRWTLARGADVLARAQRGRGRPQSAVAAHRTSLEAWRLLREMDPGNVSWQREWAKSTSLLADSLRLVGRVEESVKLHQGSISVLEEMMASGDLAHSFMTDVIQQELSSAEGLLSIGELRQARAELRSARSRLGKAKPASLKQRRGGDLGIRAGLIDAELLLAEGRWPGARARALRVMEAIQARAMRGSDRGLRLDRARALLVSSAVAEIEGNSELAVGNGERALGLLDELRKERPAEPELMALQARAHFTLGREVEAEKAIEALDELGFRDARLTALRAAASQLSR